MKLVFESALPSPPKEDDAAPTKQGPQTKVSADYLICEDKQKASGKQHEKKYSDLMKCMNQLKKFDWFDCNYPQIKVPPGTTIQAL